MDALLGFFGEGDGIIQILWFFMFILFVLFGPKLMMTQTVWKLEKDVLELEQLAIRTRKRVERAVPRGKENKRKITEFMDFFAVSPVSIDPYGIMKKIEHIVRHSDRRFKYFVNQIAPKLSAREKDNLKNALAGAISTHQIAKVVRHLLELIKKYKILQLAMILQMQFPLIKDIAHASSKATDAFILGTPIGDGIGPLVVASLIPARARVKIDKYNDFAVARVQFGKRKVLVAKADGPGATTGYPGKFLASLVKKNRITKIITVDAALKLEGEKIGTVSEGIGVAMGGIGVDRYEIENFAVSRSIPLDAVVVKVSQREALEPMRKEVLASVPKAVEKVKESLAREKGKVLILGVGNTCGVGNNITAARKAELLIRKNSPRKKHKKKWWQF